MNPSSCRGQSRIRFDREAFKFSEAIRLPVHDHVAIENENLAKAELAQWAGAKS